MLASPVTGGGDKVDVVSVLLLGRLFGARDTGGLLGTRDTGAGGC